MSKLQNDIQNAITQVWASANLLDKVRTDGRLDSDTVDKIKRPLVRVDEFLSNLADAERDGLVGLKDLDFIRAASNAYAVLCGNGRTEKDGRVSFTKKELVEVLKLLKPLTEG